jgi:hypothetical protein
MVESNMVDHSFSMNDREAADYLGVAVSTMRKWRLERRGPAYCKLGRRVTYLVNDLNQYRESRRVEPML